MSLSLDSRSLQAGPRVVPPLLCACSIRGPGLSRKRSKCRVDGQMDVCTLASKRLHHGLWMQMPEL